MSKSIRKFRKGETKVLVATSDLVQEFEMDQIGFIVNFDLSDIWEYYQRVERYSGSNYQKVVISIVEKNEMDIFRRYKHLRDIKVEKYQLV